MKMNYEFTGEVKEHLGVTLKRIRATADFTYKYGRIVKKGELGGWIEKRSNLSENAWVFGDAMVYGYANVCGNAWVCGNARVFGDAIVYGDAIVFENARVFGNARVYGDARVYGYARVYGDAWVYDNMKVYGDTKMYNNAKRITMLNQDKFKTAEERIKAFDSFCNSDCSTCPIDKMNAKDNYYHCMAYWLALPYEEEKPEPCPFCGKYTEEMARHVVGGFCVACECGYTSAFGETKAAAISTHNRVCRAVRAANGDEVE